MSNDWKSFGKPIRARHPDSSTSEVWIIAWRDIPTQGVDSVGMDYMTHDGRVIFIGRGDRIEFMT